MTARRPGTEISDEEIPEEAPKLKKILPLLLTVLLLLPLTAPAEGMSAPGSPLPPQTVLPSESPTPTPRPTPRFTSLPTPTPRPTRVPLPQPGPGVTYVDLGEGKRKIDAVIGILQEYPDLRKVDMFETPVTEKDIAKLEKAFPDVTFGWTLRIGDHLVRTDAEVFSTLHWSDSRKHYDDAFALLRYCTKLQALDIGHNHCRDISWLRNMPHMKVLIIAINDIRDISPLAELKDLEYLELFTNHVSDISPLAGLKKLRYLNLAFNNISDYTPLYGMTQLKMLWLLNSNNYVYGDHIPPETVAALKARLPGTWIDTSSQPTSNGWRETEINHTIRNMFRRNGRYESTSDEDYLVTGDDD